MKYRVSFYLKGEVVSGRAPRYMLDIESETQEDVLSLIAKDREGVVIRSIYKAPEKPIRRKPSFVFETSAARNKWYRSNKTTQKGRVCRTCNKNEVKRYKRVCDECGIAAKEKLCGLCGKKVDNTRRKFCDACSNARKESQEKSHRVKRAKQTTIDRIHEQIKWAEEKLKTTTLQNCKFASRYQGLRVPHVTEDENGNNPRRCRVCLQKFIDVQRVYLVNLLIEKPEPEKLESEPEHAHAASV